MLDNPALESLFGPRATRELRSSPLKIIAGPSANEDEELSRLVRVARVAEGVGDWTTVAAKASQILSIHPKSVLALCLQGDALRSTGHEVEAITAFKAALEILEANADLRTPQFEDKLVRNGTIAEIETVLGELAPDQ